MNQEQNWKQYKKVDLERLSETVARFNKEQVPGKTTAIDFYQAESILQAPSLKAAIAYVVGTGVSPIQADVYIARLVWIYEDLMKGVKNEGGNILAVSVSLTEEELGQINAEMELIGIKDREVFMRAALGVYSLALALAAKVEPKADAVVMRVGHFEMAVPLYPKK